MVGVRRAPRSHWRQQENPRGSSRLLRAAFLPHGGLSASLQAFPKFQLFLPKLGCSSSSPQRKRTKFPGFLLIIERCFLGRAPPWAQGGWERSSSMGISSRRRWCGHGRGSPSLPPCFPPFLHPHGSTGIVQGSLSVLKGVGIFFGGELSHSQQQHQQQTWSV